jgi:hypothetical protein
MQWSLFGFFFVSISIEKHGNCIDTVYNVAYSIGSMAAQTRPVPHLKREEESVFSINV